MQQLHPAPETQYKNMIEMVIGNKMLEREGYKLFDHDMVSGSEPSSAAPIVNFIHSKYGRWILVRSRPLF